MRALSFLCLLFGFLVTEAHAAPAGGLLDFRGNLFGALQGGGNGISAQITWNPKFKMSDRYGVGLNIGPTYLPGIGGGGYLALEYAALGYYVVNPTWFAELGLGAQTWFNSSNSTAMEALAGVGMHLDKKYLYVIDTVFVQYGLFMQSPLTHVVKLGVQISL